MDPDPEPLPPRADLLTIALLVFFVALIAIVAGLMLLPQFAG